MELETYSTGATVTTTETPEGADGYPSFMGFDQMQSFYVDVEAKPSPNVLANVSLNILGNVPENPIDEIFYENRGRKRTVALSDGTDFTYEGFDRLKVYRANVSWDDKWFELNGFYRTGHLHWGFEGDFFGLYRNAFYGENIDIYNGMAPIGFEVAGKKDLAGLKAAFGPQLWWGANPTVFLKYQRQVGRFAMTGVYQEDVGMGNFTTATSSVVPMPETRKASLQAVTSYGPWQIEGGTLWAGSEKEGDTFQLYDDRGETPQILTDQIKPEDSWGFKGKISIEKGAFRWYGQGAYMGLVADAGPTETITFTGWKLKDSGMGNQKNVISGFTYNHGNWQIGPNFLWQKPIVGPIPGDAPDPGAPRSYLYNPAAVGTPMSDPFAVLGNREMTAFEVLFTYDPHPATWFYAWDNDKREGARLAWNLGFVYKDMPTTRDALVFYDTDGVTRYAFPGAAPAHTEWEIHSRLAGRLGQQTRLVANIYAGQAEPNGWIYADPTTVGARHTTEQLNRIIHRYGVDARLVHKHISLTGMLKINDWGIYDYHKDWNLTYPMQIMGDISYSLGKPGWFEEKDTRIGFRVLYRTLDLNSNRYYLPQDNLEEALTDELYQEFLDQIDRNGDGTEWEFRTYLHVVM